MSIGNRLKQAVQRNYGGTVLRFQEDMAKHKIKGTSYPAITSYLNDDTVPSVRFLKAAAELLGVRPEWLILGEGPRVEGVTDPIYGWEREEQGRDEATIRQLAPGLRQENLAHRRALRRFSHKLADAETPESTWSNGAYRALLLGAAYRFLEEMEKAFAKALEFPEDADLPEEDAKILRKLGLLDHLALKESSSKGWQVTWTDAVLDLFARRVYGLGERAGGFYDTHARPNPLRIGDEQDTREGGTDVEA